jgi:predicted ATPase/class 3 adenylate cyclase
VTFLFTDIEGSTRLWQQNPDAMGAALARHDALLREAIEQNEGRVFKMMGDAFCSAFPTAGNALAAARAAQFALAQEPWPEPARIKVRMALHTGAAEVRDHDYFGLSLSRVARLLTAAHGGQILLSLATQELVRDGLPEGVTLRDMGERRLKDLIRPERVYQLIAPELQAEFSPLKTLDARAHNLPIQLTSFIGREREMQQLKSMLGSARLVTLLGMGGAGKTRLALQAGADRIDDFADGVWLVELAPLTDKRLVPQTVATVLGINEQPGVAITDTLTRKLKTKELLVILDNCEHVVEASARLCQALLAACASVRILSTSREALRVPGETICHVRSLATPEPNVPASVESLTQYAAARLFIDRAVAAQPAFRVNNANAPAVASICQHLDGIPLAIELAAARVRSMSAEEVNQRLDQRFRLLTDGSRTALPRQQTLRALIDWSYALLNGTEQALLCRLAVFAGGWTLAAAEAICAGEPVETRGMLDILTSLADKSLILAEERSGATRYRLLETVREYARDRMRERGEDAHWHERHLAHFLALAEEGESQLMGTDQRPWLDRLEVEHDNLRSALAWSAAAAGDANAGLRLAAALFRFWSIRGYLAEGRDWLSALLAAAPDGRVAARARALSGAGGLAWQQGDNLAARTLHGECLAIRRELGDRRGIAATLSNLGIVSYDEGDYPIARKLIEEALAIQRELGHKRGIAHSLNNLGIVASDEGDYASARVFHEECVAIQRELGDRRGVAVSLNNVAAMAHEQGESSLARTLHEQSLAIFRELGDRRGTADALNGLGNVVRDRGDLQSAKAFQEESLAICRELGDRRGIAISLEGLADVAAALGVLDRAARIWGAAERIREEIGSPLRPGERPRYDRQVAAARVALGNDGAFDRAWQAGRALTREEAIELALAQTAER